MNDTNQVITNQEVESTIRDSQQTAKAQKPAHLALREQQAIFEKQNSAWENKYDEAIQFNVQLEKKVIQQSDAMKSMAVQIRTLQNRMGANVTNAIVDEARREEVDPSRIVAHTMIQSAKKIAQKAREENHGRYVYWF